LSVAAATASLPMAYQSYLAESWANDTARRRKAGGGEEIPFQVKLRMALAQI
jgi:SRSO17 transposase